MSTPSRPWLLILAALVFSSCASQKHTERPRLPFHVAVIPVAVERLAPSQLPEAETEDGELPGKEMGLELELTPQLASRRLGKALRQNFVEVTELPCCLTDEEWVTEAERVGADLIVKGNLAYGPKVLSALNEHVYYNFPLFLLGGPVSWFVRDRDYFLVNDLRVELYDMSILSRSEDYGGARLGDRIALVASNASTLKETSLAFTKRGVKSPASLATSLLIPVGFIAKSNETVSENLGDNILHALCEDATAALYDGASNHLVNPTLFDFAPHIEFRETGTALRSARDIDLSIRLEGEEISELSRYEILDGATVVASADFDPSADGTYRVQLPEDEGGPLRVRVIDASAHQNARTFTLRSRGSEGTLTGSTADFD